MTSLAPNNTSSNTTNANTSTVGSTKWKLPSPEKSNKPTPPALPTPGIFLRECLDLKLTPLIQPNNNSSETNPFEASFDNNPNNTRIVSPTSKSNKSSPTKTTNNEQHNITIPPIITVFNSMNNTRNGQPSGESTGSNTSSNYSKRLPSASPIVDLPLNIIPSTTTTTPTTETKNTNKKRKSIATSSNGGDDTEEKRRRMLERNREAAVKSREKKKKLINQLEQTHTTLRNENSRVKTLVAQLGEQIEFLKSQASLHEPNCRCGIHNNSAFRIPNTSEDRY